MRITLGELLHDCANTYWDKPCLTDAETGQVVTYGELEQQVNCLANGFRQGLSMSNNYVAILLENSIKYIQLTYALKKIDLIEVSINRAFRGESLKRMINLTASEVLVTSPSHFDALEAVIEDLTQLKTIVIIDENEKELKDAQNRFNNFHVLNFNQLISNNSTHPVSTAKDTDVAAIMFTSGTTGVSKGCMLSHRYAVRTAECMIEPFRLTANDINYTPYPLSHIGPAYYEFLPMLMTGGQTILRNGFSLSSFWPEVARYGATWFMCLGSVQQLLYSATPCAKEKQHQVTRCWATPAPVPKEDFDRRFNLHLIPGGGYGSTDAGWVVVPQWDNPGGVVLPHFDIAIVDENDDPVPPGEDGELIIRPLEPGVMSDGYFGMPEKTLESRRNLWFHTGDIACIDNEGLFHFRCRIAERIRVRGEMVSGFEVEEAVLSHPCVEDAAAIGVPAAMGEEDIHLFVTLKSDSEMATDEIGDQLKQYCKDRMARFMVPSVVTVLEDMPRTTTGKTEKGTLRDIAIRSSKIGN